MPARLLIALAAFAAGAPGSWNGVLRKLPAEECAIIAAAIPALARTPNGFRRGLQVSALAMPTRRSFVNDRSRGLDHRSDAADLRSCRAAARAAAALDWRLVPITENQRQGHDVRPLHWISRADLYAGEGRATVWIDDQRAVNLIRSDRRGWTAETSEPMGDPLE
jgi:hypothetical protein